MVMKLAMAVWRETHPIWLKPASTTAAGRRGGPDTAWEGVFPPDRVWRWSREKSAVRYVVLRRPDLWRVGWRDIRACIRRWCRWRWRCQPQLSASLERADIGGAGHDSRTTTRCVLADLATGTEVGTWGGS